MLEAIAAAKLALAALQLLRPVLQSYMEQLREQSRLIEDFPHHVEQLENDLSFLIKFMEEREPIVKKMPDNLITRDLLENVRNNVYDAEVALDSFLIDAVGSKSKNWSKSKLAKIAKLVEFIGNKVKTVRDKVEREISSSSNTREDGEFEEYEGPPEKPNVVGFAVEEQQLSTRLQKPQQLDVIFITGTHGVGKTTLAAKIFHDSKIREKFTIPPIWVRVYNPTTKNILLSILRQLDNLPQDASRRSDQGLSQLVADCLKGKTCLIVMDKVPEIDDRATLMRAFESSDKNSKVLITTNNNEMARVIDPHNPSIEVKPLKHKESWQLLQQQVFGQVGLCPQLLEVNGRLIAEQCGGLPSAIVTVAEILAKKDSPLYEMSARVRIWDKVCRSMNTYFNNDSQLENSSILSSYNKLSYHLRACFLYMGIFPERSKFSVSKLIRMWIAEGFIRRVTNLSLEEAAVDCLESLIDKNLVIVEEKNHDGSAKLCSMNYLLYDFCKTEAGNERENFLQEVKKSRSDGAFQPPIAEVQKYRRVCIHADISTFISKFLSLRNPSLRLRSFVSHSKELCTLKKRKEISIIRAAFKLLRVLDAKPIGFTKIPTDLYQLVHLRYVTLSLDGAVLPANISKLQQIQTLVVHTSSRSLKVKADILKMDGLRHFKTNASATLLKTRKSCEKDEALQTLCGISPKSCTEIFFDKAPNLKKLGIRGQLALLLDGRNGLLSKLGKVEKLKLLNDVASSKGKLCCPPQHSQFPPNLRSLTMSATSLDWGHISILGSLQTLKELKLRDDAFKGETWEVSGNGFPHLQSLHIERVEFIHWKASIDHFPELRKLQLSNCTKLMELPSAPAGYPKLQKLHVSNGTKTAADSARRIRDAKNGEVFLLSIFPDDKTDHP